ncbi:MATE family efflux transporter [Virgibacillus soli]
MENSRLHTQSALRSFFQYFIPTLFGMMLMSINIVIDGIFVGNGVGAVALASVNIAVPVFSIIISIALLIGVGGGTMYAMALGEGNQKRAHKLFTISIVIVTAITLIISFICYLNLERLAYIFGANSETFGYVEDYMIVLLGFSIIIALESTISIFVRNDGAPTLAMVGLVASAIMNIMLNYWFIFILDLKVTGAALATVLATLIGLLILCLQLFRKNTNLRFIKFTWSPQEIKRISFIGFPSFLSEVGMGIFVMGYNIAMAYYVGTNGLAAFSVINYLHTFMFLAFIGIGSSIQPMISFYYGAKKFKQIKETVKIAEVTGLGLGILFILIGWFGADYLVAIFGVDSTEITALATKGIKLFFLGYLFMGINFIYMTYFQSIGYVRPSIGITVFRGYILLIGMLLILPYYFGITGIWLALPIAEAIVAVVLIIFGRTGVMDRGLKLRNL